MVAPIVFIGDSITELWGFHRAETFATHGLIPRGGSGQTARWVAMRFRRDLVETGAQGVHLLCGINDIGRNEGFFVPAEEIGETLAAMLDEARAMGVTAWVGSIMPAARIPWNPEVADTPAMIAAVNRWLRVHAAEHGASFIDYHAVLADETGALREAYGTDGLHLSPEGYAAIELLMLTALGRIAPPEPAPAVARPGARPAAGRLKLAILAAASAVVLILLALWASKPAEPSPFGAPSVETGGGLSVPKRCALDLSVDGSGCPFPPVPHDPG